MKCKSVTHRILAVIIVASVYFLISCKPGVPNKYVQPGKMEDILYEYHIAEGISGQSKAENERAINQRAYQLAILKQHGVTEAEFDSSMVYYMRHTEQLHTIYENVVKRMDNEATSLGTSANSIGDASLSANGDTANVWTGNRSLVFTTSQPFNLSTYSFKTDTTFHKGDALALNFDTQFIYQDGVRDGIAVFAVRFGNDSVAYRRMNISSSSRYNMQINDYNHLGFKEIRGFFILGNNSYMNQSTSTLQILFVQNIRLIRMHENKNTKQPVVRQDSIQRDTARQRLRQQPLLRQGNGRVAPRTIPNIPNRPINNRGLPLRSR